MRNLILAVFAALSLTAGVAPLASAATFHNGSVMVEEGLLHRVQSIVLTARSLDGGDLGVLGRDGEREAGEHPLAVRQYIAGPARLGPCDRR